ncbi:MAG: hypothetical protein DME13_03870 [Candidatus Rokuibacteriota bacterium]|nr:MAG: hypothetical protein DME13_03870 [Candidatus Rokubacteria bacterium]
MDAILEDHPGVVKSFPHASSTRCGAVAASDLDIVRRGDDSSATQLSGRRLRPAAEQEERGCATHQEGPRRSPGPAVVAF